MYGQVFPTFAKGPALKAAAKESQARVMDDILLLKKALRRGPERYAMRNAQQKHRSAPSQNDLDSRGGLSL